jgi:hypothetical protein
LTGIEVGSNNHRTRTPLPVNPGGRFSFVLMMRSQKGFVMEKGSFALLDHALNADELDEVRDIVERYLPDGGCGEFSLMFKEALDSTIRKYIKKFGVRGEMCVIMHGVLNVMASIIVLQSMDAKLTKRQTEVIAVGAAEWFKRTALLGLQTYDPTTGEFANTSPGCTN